MPIFGWIQLWRPQTSQTESRSRSNTLLTQTEQYFRMSSLPCWTVHFKCCYFFRSKCLFWKFCAKLQKFKKEKKCTHNGKKMQKKRGIQINFPVCMSKSENLRKVSYLRGRISMCPWHLETIVYYPFSLWGEKRSQLCMCIQTLAAWQIWKLTIFFVLRGTS